ncbi:MAG: hypothetical protein ACREFS_12470 [Acetobacteraceae bacterium]
MNARFREAGQPPPAKPPKFPHKPAANDPRRRPGPREKTRLAILAILAEDATGGGGEPAA